MGIYISNISPEHLEWVFEMARIGANNPNVGRYVVAEQVPDHGDLIDRNALYEKTAEWEAQALHMCEVTMHDEDTTEWKRWSTILNERSAFKYDVADAPAVYAANENEWIPISCLPMSSENYLVLCNEWGKPKHRICSYHIETAKWIENGKYIKDNVITHWMPLPDDPV